MCIKTEILEENIFAPYNILLISIYIYFNLNTIYSELEVLIRLLYC